MEKQSDIPGTSLGSTSVQTVVARGPTLRVSSSAVVASTTNPTPRPTEVRAVPEARREGYWDRAAEKAGPDECEMCGQEHSVARRDVPDRRGRVALCSACWSLWEG